MIEFKGVFAEQVVKENLPVAIAAGKKVFPKDSRNHRLPERAYRYSLNLKRAPKEVREEHRLMIYYLIYNQEKEVIGITGLYQCVDDPEDTYWLGWYGVIPEFRSKRYGTVILEFTEQLVIERQGTVLKLWTTEEPDEAAAQFVFEKMNYKIVERTKGNLDETEYDILIRSKTL